MADAEKLSVAIVGAGSIGCYVGGLLKASGHDVTFIGRKSLGDRLAEGGLRLRTMAGDEHHVIADEIAFATTMEAASGSDYALVCVKSMDTAEVGQELRAILSKNATVVSLQNGLDNPATLAEALPDHAVRAGMVAFNVVEADGPAFTATTEGGIYLEHAADTKALADALSQAGIETTRHENMPAVQWSKLLLNLNNALNALSGKPLAEQLRDRRWRRVLARCVREGLQVMRAVGIDPVRFGKVRPGIVPLVLSLPDFLFERVASQMLKVDPKARSSMADDYARGRPPEIDYLNGAIVSHGERLGIATPANAATCAAITRLFAGEIETPVDPDSLTND